MPKDKSSLNSNRINTGLAKYRAQKLKKWDVLERDVPPTHVWRPRRNYFQSEAGDYYYLQLTPTEGQLEYYKTVSAAVAYALHDPESPCKDLIKGGSRAEVGLDGQPRRWNLPEDSLTPFVNVELRKVYYHKVPASVNSPFPSDPRIADCIGEVLAWESISHPASAVKDAEDIHRDEPVDFLPKGKTSPLDDTAATAIGVGVFFALGVIAYAACRRGAGRRHAHSDPDLHPHLP